MVPTVTQGARRDASMEAAGRDDLTGGEISQRLTHVLQGVVR
jgi:hypothetical protein